MLPNLSSTITRSRSLLQSTSSARQPCFPRHITRPSLLPLLPHHPPSFSTSNPRLSRGSKSNKAKQSAESPSSPLPFGSSSTTGSSGNLPGGSPAPDPFDFSLLDAAHERLVTKLQTDLGKLKPGGLSLDAVEGVRVELTGTDGLITAKGKGREKEKEKGGRVRVGDIAQVLVRGRICVVLVGEKEHIKPLLSALRSSLTLPTPPTFTTSATPEIHIPIPPTTGESRAQAQLAAKHLGENAVEHWNEARGEERKRLRALKLGRMKGGPKVSADTIWKAEEQLTKMYEKVLAEVKTLVEETRKGLNA